MRASLSRFAGHLFWMELDVSQMQDREKAEMSTKGVLPNTIIANYYILYISYYIILLHI